MGFELPGMDFEVKTTIPAAQVHPPPRLSPSPAYAISEALGLGLNPLEAAGVAYTAEGKGLDKLWADGSLRLSPGGLCYIDCSIEPPQG